MKGCLIVTSQNEKAKIHFKIYGMNFHRGSFRQKLVVKWKKELCNKRTTCRDDKIWINGGGIFIAEGTILASPNGIVILFAQFIGCFAFLATPRSLLRTFLHSFFSRQISHLHAGHGTAIYS